MSISFETSQEQILAEFVWLSRYLKYCVHRMRAHYNPESTLQGVVITDNEVDALLGRYPGQPLWAEPLESADGYVDQLAHERAMLDDRAAAAHAEAIELRLEQLCRTFELNVFDRLVLLALLAPELDQGIERVYCYLQDNVTRKLPSVGFLLQLFCDGIISQFAARDRFGPTSPMLRNHLVTMSKPPGQSDVGLLSMELRIEPTVASYLLGQDELDPLLPSGTRWLENSTSLDALVLPDAVRRSIQRLLDSHTRERVSALVYLCGRAGQGRTTAAAAACTRLGIPVLRVSVRSLLMPGTSRDTFEQQLRRVARQAGLHRAAVVWVDADPLFDDDGALDAFLSLARERSGLDFLVGSRDWVPSCELGAKRFVSLTVPQLDFAGRRAVWCAALTEREHSLMDVEIDDLATKFRLQPRQIHVAVAHAASEARCLAEDVQGVNVDGLTRAVRYQSNRTLGTIARRVETRFDWADLVLPDVQLEQLRTIRDQVHHRGVVHDQWGFGAKYSLGKGLSALFSGPPGTGKTMAAEVIARSLGLELYKVDLSQVVSKYIGETEKNLARVFAEAEDSNAVLFFDEADALFGKRTDVHSSHDRNANMETSYLLQRIEEYEGIVILATNLAHNMDEAFLRRLAFRVEFSVPNATQRERIWRGVWPSDCPLDDDLDPKALAHKLEVSGGHIRNIAMAAAFYAASERRDGAHGACVVRWKHVMQAARSEYRKLGLTLTER
jgi:hypothetical protein